MILSFDRMKAKSCNIVENLHNVYTNLEYKYVPKFPQSKASSCISNRKVTVRSGLPKCALALSIRFDPISIAKHAFEV
jgi:hypothetical protein